MKELSKAQKSALETLVRGKSKICRIHIEIKALDYSNNRGTISNFLTLPYFSGCSSDLLNDQLTLNFGSLLSLSTEVGLTYQTTAECDGGDDDVDNRMLLTVVLVLGLTTVYIISLYGSYILGKKNIDIRESVLRIFSKKLPSQGEDKHYQQLVE